MKTSQARAADQLSKEHFSVDGTLSLKSYRLQDEDEPPTQNGGRNPPVDFRGEKRSRETHESKTDPGASLFKKSKGTAARLSYMGNLLMENRHRLIVDAQVTQAAGTAELEGEQWNSFATSFQVRIRAQLASVAIRARVNRRLLDTQDITSTDEMISAKFGGARFSI